MTMNKIYFILSFIFLLSGLSLQGQTLAAYEDAAREAFEAEEYSSALSYYESALEIDPDKIDNLYMVAEVARLLHAYQLAEKYYLSVASHEDWAKYPHADFLLASVKKRLGKYAEAGDLFQRFVDNASADIVGDKFIKDAKREVSNCQIAPEIVNDSLEYITTTNLVQYNTINSEVAPVVRDGQVYYSSLRFEEPVDAYEPDKATVKIYKGTPELPNEKLSFIEKNTSTANAAFSSDGRTMYYTVCEFVKIGEYRCDIYKRQVLMNNEWGEAVKLPELINQPGYSSTHPNIGMDQSGKEWLFFSSDRPNGKGGMDIWCSLVASDGSYNSLLNVSDVNTYLDEVTPFFHGKQKKLYFSSNGRIANIGGFDIYSTTISEGRWSSPVNVGVPLNSSYNDTYFALDESGRNGYFSSNRPGAVHIEDRPEYETCCPDIYHADIDLTVDLIASTFNGLSQLELLGVDVRLINEATGEVVPMTRDAEGNRSFFGLQVDQEYILTGGLSQYTSDTVRFNTKGITSSTTIEKELFLSPPIDLTALVFEQVSELPLTGVTMRLVEMPQANLLENRTNNDDNEFGYKIDFEKQYKLIASKPNYSTAEVVISTLDLEKIPTQITKELYLRPQTIDLPVVLYFDNDRPGRRTLSTTTNKTYGETFEAYYAKKDEFVREYVQSAGVSNARQARAEMETFFEDQVLEGYNKLEIVSESLLDYLQNGNSMEISIRGFASPRAGKEYNENLTKRRIVSLKNHFSNYRDGIFRQYLNSRQLVLVDSPFGENSAPTGIASEYDDPESVYSIRASAERRVEIIEVRRGGLSSLDSKPPNSSSDKK